MRYPWANVVLLVVLMAQLLTGFWGLITGTSRLSWILWLHSIGAYAVVVVFVWKGAIILDVLRRRRWTFTRVAFLFLTALLLAILATGYLWTYGGAKYLSVFSLMTVHALLAIGLTALLLWHVLARRFILRVPRARDRRAFLRLVGASLAGAVLWQAAGVLKTALALPGAMARFTGSYETGSFTGTFPIVSWLFDDPAPIDLNAWRLTVDGLVDRPLTLNYEQLRQLPADTLAETIDCTGGWYSTQEWSGVGLARLLDMAGMQNTAQSVTVVGVSGYYRRYSPEQARACMLATHVGGQPLAQGHGFPLRLVAPGQRGFAWVKWVTHVYVSDVSDFWQPPVPLQ